MSEKNFIDLSLSTDDEVTPKPSRLRGTRRETVIQPKTDLLLSDRYDGDTYSGFSWDENLPKRRRKNPVQGTEPTEASFRALAEMRANSNINCSSRSARRCSAVSKPCDESDPIIFTSSPKRDPKPSHEGKKRHGSFSYLSDKSSDELPEDPTMDLPGLPRVGSHLSNRTAALIASLGNPPNRRKSSNPGHETTIETISPPSQRMTSPISSPHKKPEKSRKTKKAKPTDAEKEAKTREKEEAKAASKAVKDQARENEKQKKQMEKESKARDKQVAKDLDEVNKAKWKKDVAAPEMIVDLPKSMDGQSVCTQTTELLNHQKIQTTVYHSPLPNVIRWRRKTTAEYNDEMGHWVPTHEKIINEKHVMCFITAQDFVAKVTADSSLADGEDLDIHVLKLKSSFENCAPIYLIEGLAAWMRKNSTVRNRAYQAAVLNQNSHHNKDHPSGSQQAKSRHKKPAQAYIEEDVVEDALLRLQIIHGCLIHHTAVTMETATWISNFTQHIATIPYKFAALIYMLETVQ